MNNKIQQIRKLVKRKYYKEIDWKYHLMPVMKYARKLAKKYKINKEILELAVLLHDVAWAQTIKNDEIHHTVGACEAEKILRKYKFPEDIIEQVKHCVLSHRGIKGPKPKTMVAKILVNADAMSHFDVFPIFFYWRAKRGYSFEEVAKWTEEKMIRNWQKKITLPGAKEMVRDKYQASILFFRSIKKL